MEEYYTLFQYLNYMFHNNIIFQFLGLFSFVLISTYLVLQLSFVKRRKFPPGPRGLPFFGYFPFMGKEHHKTLARLSKRYGPVFSVPLGRTRVVFCNDWESVKDALGKNTTLDRQIDTYDLPNGLGFGKSNGQEWLEQRRLSMKVMRDIGLGRPKWEDMLNEEVNDILQELEKHHGEPVDTLPVFEGTFSNNILSLAFGQRLPLSQQDAKYINEMMDLTIRSLAPTALSNYLPGLSKVLYALGLYGSDSAGKLKEYDKFMRDLIKKRLQQQGDEDEDSFVMKYAEESQNKLKSGEKTTLTEESLYANVQTLILGGSETARSSLQWLLIAMAENINVQDRVHRELDSVLGRDGALRWSDRNKVPYTYACIMEGQRWKTLVPVALLRSATEDTTILDYDIPKGTSIGSNSWALHNDPKYWPQPEKYDPTRMLIDDGKQFNPKPESYNPFSHGRRNCPGENIAMTELLVYFTKIMQKFTILPEKGSTVKYITVLSLTYFPTNFKLRFIARE